MTTGDDFNSLKELLEAISPGITKGKNGRPLSREFRRSRQYIGVMKVMHERSCSLTKAVETYAAEAKLSVRTVWSAMEASWQEEDLRRKAADDALEPGDVDDDDEN